MADVGAADLKGAKKLKPFLQFVPHRNSFAVFSKFSIAQRQALENANEICSFINSNLSL